MPLESFIVVDGNNVIGTAATFPIDPVPTLPVVHGTQKRVASLTASTAERRVAYLFFDVPAGDKSEVSLNVLSKTPSTVTVKRTPSPIETFSGIDVIYLLEGLHALTIDANGRITITNVNEATHAFRQQFPTAFPSEVDGITIANNGQVSDTLFVATVIRHPQPPATIQPTTGGVPSAPPFDAVAFENYTIAASIEGKVFVETLESPPAEEDDKPAVQPDQGPPLTPDLDLAITVFRSTTTGEIDSDTKFFLGVVNVKNVSAVSTPGVAVNYFRIDPDLGDVFLTSSTIGTLSPGQSKGVSTGLRLRTTKDFQPLVPGNHIIKAQLGNVVLPGTIKTTAYSDAESSNDSRTITMKLLAPGEVPTVLPPPSASGSGGSGSSNNFSPTPTGDQINVVVDDINSQSIYEIQPGDEFQSNWIETNIQATRVAESIIWQKNQVIVVSCTVPYNPDLRRGLTVSFRVNRIGFRIMGLVKTVGHTFSGTEDRPASTQVIIRATEYIFESSLAQLGQEVFDRRQKVLVDSPTALSSI
jgi:hypothetical protein